MIRKKDATRQAVFMAVVPTDFFAVRRVSRNYLAINRFKYPKTPFLIETE